MNLNYKQSTLADKAMLVRVRLPAPFSSKKDREGTEEFALHHGMNPKSVSVGLNQFASSERFKKIKALRGALDREVKRMTVVWEDGGVRALHVNRYDEFTQTVRDITHQIRTAAQDIADHYDEELQQEQRDKNGKFNMDDYPYSIDTEVFIPEVRLRPIPTNDDWRVEVSKEDKDALDSALHQMEQQITHDLVARLIQPVKALANKLSEYSGYSDDGKRQRFAPSLVTNVTDMVSHLRGMNADFGNDSQLAALLKEVDDALRPYAFNPEALKESQPAREAAKAKLDDIMSKFAF